MFNPKLLGTRYGAGELSEDSCCHRKLCTRIPSTCLSRDSSETEHLFHPCGRGDILNLCNVNLQHSCLVITVDILLGRLPCGSPGHGTWAPSSDGTICPTSLPLTQSCLEIQQVNSPVSKPVLFLTSQSPDRLSSPQVLARGPAQARCSPRNTWDTCSSAEHRPAFLSAALLQIQLEMT